MAEQSTSQSERKWIDLTMAQQSVWLDAKLSGTSDYQLGGWARVAAPLDEAAVRRSVRLVMARHDALRLRVDDELPRQWLDESPDAPMTVIDLEFTGDPDEAFRRHVEAVFTTAMPMGDRPLFQIELIRAGENLCYLLWRFHHVIADSASVLITLSHWFAAYDALTSSTPAELAPPSSYVKTVATDARYLESAAYHQDLAYWSSRFDPLPPALIADMELRTSEPRKVPTADYVLVGDRFTQFQKSAQAAGTTVHRALFALFAMTLGRRFGQTDVVSGVALHRRDLTNRHTIGMMAGVIPVRCQFDSDGTLEDGVRAFSEQLDKDLRNQRLPVDVLSRALGLSGTGRAGLFEVAMSYIPADRGESGSPLEDLPVTVGVVDTKEASPISLHATDRVSPEGLSARIAVNTDFLDAAESETLSLLLQSAIDRYISNPDALLVELDTASPAERGRVVDESNRTVVPFATGTLHGLFTEQALRTPDAIAVISVDGKELTYAELEKRSASLALHLIERGVSLERVVGVRMQRSTETIIALLAILKAGGVYLPLDPAYPAERLDYIAKDAGAMLVLESIDGLEGQAADLPVFADPDRLAYIIYTSGTTGQPKGVAVTHTPAVNLAFARCAAHDPIGVGDRVLAGISVGFDVSIGQLLLPLLSGATVVIAGDLKTLGAAEFWKFLAGRRVTQINSVPSFFDSILDAVPPAGTLALKRLMLGGEALSGALVGRIRRAIPGIQVVNMYGPTEACIDATYHVATDADLSAAVLPIGKPLPNYRAYVLDAQLNPVGVGVSGELYLGGAGLARGYVNAPQLTAEKFVADPFSKLPAARLYKTGDRARWRADGAIEFLGRVDQQVKIRGFRVEPEEIAATLLTHPDILQAVVVPRASKPGAPPRLIAYFVPQADQSVPDIAALRDYLAGRLPDYMVPSALVPLADIPLNRNGKLDVNALPNPDLAEGDYVAPRTATEETIAGLFAEVLGLDRCSATAHFFELGGHSLLATGLISKMREAGMIVPLRAIFETPTVEMLARRVDASLPAAKAADTIPPQPRDGDIPLSFPQERIWFVDRLQQDSSYNIPIAFELRGRLDLAAAERAVQRIVDRHEALRTRIVIQNGRPAQEIVPAAPIDMQRVDLSALKPLDLQENVRRRVAEVAKHRFDLANDLPIKLLLITAATDRHILVAVVHHVAFDGWSAGLFLSEFAALYAAYVQNQPDPLTVPPIQYADFSIWQRRQDSDADLAFWLDELAGAPATLEMPAQNLPADKASRQSGTLPLQLTAATSAALQKLANDNTASVFMVLHAAFALLLSRISGQDDVVIGTVAANRNRSEFESVIGCFVNTLPLRTKLAAGESFTQLLNRVKNADLAAYAHQDLPFERLVEALHPERSLQHTPIFQVMFVLQNMPMPTAQLEGLTLEPIPVDAEMAKFDLTLTFAEADGQFAGAIEFAENRFDTTFIESLAAKLKRLIEAVVADPSQDASRIDLLDAIERQLVLEEWNNTEQHFDDQTLDVLFAAQARQTPDAVAVIGVDGAELSYAELDKRSTTLARQLAANGVGPDRVVGVRMIRSTETVIALLAILKAGGVYLPLDPAYPADRLDYIARDAGALIILDSIENLTGDGQLPNLADPERLAYVIYTSGTTGKPKGVAVPHRAAVNLAVARRAGHDPIGVGDRVLAGISVGFDVSIGQLLLPLLSGATVVIADDLKKLGAGQFWALLAERRVTHINSVPSFVDSILDAAPPAGTLALKRLMLGGETLSGTLVGRIQRTLPGVQVVNMYGPTEACIDATYHIATPADLTAAVLPIGKPLANYQAYVLDAQLQPVGIGESGELYLGGAGLARGYVNAPGLTAERFIADPFHANRRLYKTGDRARWRADGVIEFLGRVDQQVKIRGFRVEPEEIEAQLKSQPGVRDAAVIAAGNHGSMRLIAYCTGDFAPESLRAGLAATLPDYMVPSAFVKLDQLPLTANGKLDRKALPKPDQGAFVSRPFEPPVGDVEQKTAALWAELLKIERVGRHDNFFELGGHSLLAVTLIERMQQQGLPGDVRALFTTPTVAGLAAAASVDQRSIAPPNLILPKSDRITPEMLPLANLNQAQIDRIVETVPGGTGNVQDIYALSPLQEGILFQHLVTAKGDPYLSPFLLGFDTRDRLDTFITALNRLVHRHDVLRTAMVWNEVDEPVQIVLRNVSVPIEEVTLDSATDAAAQLKSRFDPAVFRLDLSSAPLLRVVIAHDARQHRWLLLMLTHHLVLDHTSLEILVGELRALVANPQIELPPSLPYRNFIAQTRTGKTRAEHEAFFTRLLGDVDEPTAPFGLLDIQSNASQTSEGRLKLDPQVSVRIRDRSRALGVTPASLFHLAWASVLGYASSKSDVIFGTILFGRMRSGAGADRVVGMFINTLPMRVKLDQTPVSECIRQTHQLLAELMDHEHAPLAIAQRCSAVPPPAPLFSSLFNYRYSAAEDDETKSSEIEMIDASERTNYPLSMAVDDSGSSFLLSALAQPGADAKKVCGYLRQALEQLLDLLDREPATPISAINVLPPDEKTLVVGEWNQTAASFEQGTLDGLFATQARRTPDAVAVVGVDGTELTYAKLDRRSTTLARQLAAAGVAPEKVVGVRMVRSTETIIALLAILKAGGVYLPLDPAYPPERLAYIAEDAGAMLVLESISGLQGDKPLPILTDADRLAYVIYTSGTTGLPKGVAVPHKAAVNLAFARRAGHDPLGVGDRVLAAISVGFDVSIGQLLLPLLSGATVVVAGDVKTMGVREFWTLLSQQRVTHINSVPSFLDSILDAAPPAANLSLKRLMLGGEALSGTLVSRIRKTLPDVQVVNMYGPTETCIDATYHVATERDLASAVLPIGRPLSNYRAYVLDAHHQLVGAGVNGELYIGGAGLARGYVNAPELTAERFIADPFNPGDRLYKTGDRARWRADGAIEFLGRVDQQVKIRGFRVEPAEVEAQLKSQPGVREAAVIAVGSNGSMRLVAYCTGDAHPDSLRAALALRLPDYMVPAALIKLDRLPLTSNGKLDRKALPQADQATLIDRPYEPPIGEVEEKMAAVWTTVLKAQRIGRNDHFFEIGGDSLAAMRLVNALNEAFKINVPIRAIFQNPTVSALTTELFSTSTPTRSRNLVPMQTGGTKPPLYFVHASSGHVFRYMSLVRAMGADQPVYGLQASGVEEGEELGRTVEDMAATYIQAVKEVQPNGPYHVLGYSSGGLLAFEMARQFTQAGDEVALLAILDTTLPDPHGDRVASDNLVLLDLASGLGIASLLPKRPPFPSLDELIDMARKSGHLPADLQTSHIHRMASVIRNTVRTVPDYQLQPWSGPTLLLRAYRPNSKRVDWSPYVPQRWLEVVDLDCTHPDLIAPAMVEAVAAHINRRMNLNGQPANATANATADAGDTRTASAPTLPATRNRFTSFLKGLKR